MFRMEKNEQNENILCLKGMRIFRIMFTIFKFRSFTGFILDQDLLDGGRKHCEVTDEMLSLLDVLVDGPFKEEEKDITLAFRGSRNQRVIDMQKSLKEKEVILYLE